MGLVFIADTSAYSKFLKDDPSFSSYFSSQTEKIYFPFVTIGEIHAGAQNGSRTRANEVALKNILSQPNTDILIPTLATTELYGTIFARLRRIGKPIGANDIWIAALALEHNLPLLTADSDFRHIQDLKLL